MSFENTHIYRWGASSPRSLRVLLWSVLGISVGVWGLSIVLRLIGVTQWPLTLSLGAYPAGYQLEHQPWGLVTYMWVHGHILHLVGNLVGLFVAGGYYIRRYRDRSLYTTFVLGGLSGALMYVLGMAVLRLMKVFPDELVLLGSSASVMALLFASVWCYPWRRVSLIVLPFRLPAVAIAVLFLISSCFPWDEVGSLLAHSGGALSGIAIAYYHRGAMPQTAEIGYSAEELALLRTREAELLDKVRQSGYESLTSQEREALYKASAWRRDAPEEPLMKL